MDSKEYELQQCPECWAVYETDSSGVFACGGHDDAPHAVAVLWPKPWAAKAREQLIKEGVI